MEDQSKGNRTATFASEELREIIFFRYVECRDRT